MRKEIGLLHALGDETRWRVIELVRERALCVCELADILGRPQSSLSSHLQVLRRAGLLESERRGKWIYYRLSGDWRPLVEAIRSGLGLSARSVPRLASDAARGARRIARRDEACCPPPLRLADGARQRGKVCS